MTLLIKINLYQINSLASDESEVPKMAIANNLLLKNTGSSNPLLALFIDLTEGFGTISHTKLLQKKKYLTGIAHFFYKQLFDC